MEAEEDKLHRINQQTEYKGTSFDNERRKEPTPDH